MNTEKVKREAWTKEGFLVVQVDDLALNAFERQFVENIGTKLFGKRK